MDIHKYIDDLNKAERDVNALSYLVIVIFVSILGYSGVLIYQEEFGGALELLAPIITLVSVLLASRVASRLLGYNKITKVDDARRDAARVYHYLMAVNNDLTSRVQYAALMLREGKRPIVAFTKNVEVIEKRYEVFFDQEIYKYLNGESIDVICRMSGSIFGLSAFSEYLRINLDGSSIGNIPDNVLSSTQKQEDALDSLIAELGIFDEQIRKQRKSLGPDA